jgi:hypothetical protein
MLRDQGSCSYNQGKRGWEAREEKLQVHGAGITCRPGPNALGPGLPQELL